MSFRSISTVAVLGNPISVPPPAGIVDGDILTAFAVSDDAAMTFTFPAGFTQVTGSPLTTTADGQRLAVATKKAASESGNYAISGVGAGQLIGGIAAHSGRDATLFLHKVSSAVNNTLNASPWTITSAAFAAATTGVADILFIAGSDTNGNSATHTPPSGFTERADISSGTFQNMTVATKDDAAAGETGVYSGTGTSSGTSGWGVFAIALLQASGGGGGGTGNRYLLEGGAGALLLEAAAGFLMLEEIAGLIARTVPMTTLVAAVAVATSGAGSATVPMSTLSGQVGVGVTAAAAKTVPMTTMAAQVSVGVTASMAVTVPMTTLAASGVSPILATHSPIVPMTTMSAQVTVPITATLNKTVPMTTLAGVATVGTVTSTVTLAATMPMSQLAGQVNSGIIGTFARTVPMTMLLASVTVMTPAPPFVDLPPGATRVVFDPSRMTVRLNASRTSLTLNASRTRARST
jgi:hypothetical protein